MHFKISACSIVVHCERLASIEPLFSDTMAKYGLPPLWNRPQVFETLIRIILEQQVSLKSAAAAFNKLTDRIGKVSPNRLLSLTDHELRECYFSRQKIVYSRELAQMIIEKKLELKELEILSNEEAKAKLMKVKGIGEWTADIYLLMAMLRADIMPRGDIALHQSWKDMSGLSIRPNSDEFLVIAEKWKPYRSCAARILWHSYLCKRATTNR